MKQGQTFKKIAIENDVYFLHCERTPDTDVTNVKLTNGLLVYTGTVSKDDLTELASQVNMDNTKFHGLFTECFCKRSSTNFVYQLHEDTSQDGCKLVWKQKLDGGIKFQLGSLALKKSIDPAANILSFFETLTGQVDELSRNVDRLQHTNETMEKEREQMTKRMGDCVKLKESLEQDLYTKFSLVLNSKKSKIRELQRQVEEGPKISKKDDRHSESDQVDTDEEKEQASKRKASAEDARGVNDVTGAINEENILLDDSIEDDDDDDLLPRKSRKRLRAAKPKTPANSVLPRTTSIPRPKQQASGRKSARRQTSKEIMDVDDLLDEL